MTPHDDRAQVEIGADTNADADAIALPDTAVRVLIFGDFAGRSANRPALEQRVIQRVDRDGIDAAIAAIAPQLRLSIDSDAPAEVIDFRELDDFHPDRLLTRVPALVRLRQLRTSVESRPLPSAVPEPPQTGDAGQVLGTGSLLDRILDGQSPVSGATPDERPPARDDLSDFIDRAVRPHVARGVDPRQRALVEQVDDVLAATLRVLLHHPEFQAVEALWRGVDFFLRRCDTDATIGVFDLARPELVAAMTEPRAGRVLRDSALRGDASHAWTLVIAAYEFAPADMELLAGIAAFAAGMHTPWLAAAQSRLAGAATFADNGDMDDWDLSPQPEWDALRRAAEAPFLGLTMPRFLLRLPYGADHPIESMSFEEFPPGAVAHERFLWGNSAFPSALVALAPVERGRPAPTQGTIDGLPLHTAIIDGVVEALPCAEVVLAQRSVLHLLGRGLTPLASEREGDAIRIPRLQSIADPPTPLPVSPAERSR